MTRRDWLELLLFGVAVVLGSVIGFVMSLAMAVLLLLVWTRL
jgi:hypothetical protein